MTHIEGRSLNMSDWQEEERAKVRGGRQWALLRQGGYCGSFQQRQMGKPFILPQNTDRQKTPKTAQEADAQESQRPGKNFLKVVSDTACWPYQRRPSVSHWQGVETDHQQPSSRCRFAFTPSMKTARADPTTSPGETHVYQKPHTLEHWTFGAANVD